LGILGILGILGTEIFFLSFQAGNNYQKIKNKK
jgi:hypothetical protein